MISSEQKCVLLRCKHMIKRAFPSMTGKLIFKLDSAKLGSSKGIVIDIFLPDLHIEETAEVQTIEMLQ